MLKNTIWVFNDTVELPTNDIEYSIEFISDGTSYDRIDFDGVGQVIEYGNVTAYQSLSGWAKSSYKTIKIIGGEDVESAELEAFLNTVATQKGGAMSNLKYTQIPNNTMETIQLNAGILVESFTPATGVIGTLIGATSGGINFTDTPTYSDWGEDIDNAPRNTKELKHLDSREVRLSGTMVTITPALAKKFAGAADIDGTDTTKIVPRDNLLGADFTDLWWIGDYSDKNTGANAGYVAIHMLNVLNTGGFQIQSADNGKGQFPFEFTAHYSIDSIDTVPYEVYVKAGS